MDPQSTPLCEMAVDPTRRFISQILFLRLQGVPLSLSPVKSGEGNQFKSIALINLFNILDYMISLTINVADTM